MEIIIILVCVCVAAIAVPQRRKRKRDFKSFDLPKEISRPAGPRPAPPTLPIRPAAPSPSNRMEQAREVSAFSGKCMVIDGDTIIVKKQRIRLFGIDAPELEHPWGQKSKWTLIGLCKGKLIRIEPQGRLSYDRIVAKCLLPDGTDLSAEMVRRGMAIDWQKFSGGLYRQYEPAGVRKRLWRADARQKGRQDLWSTPYETSKAAGPSRRQ